MQINHTRKSNCRLCNSSRLKSVLKLAATPPANAFLKKEDLYKNQEEYPLEVFYCSNCHHLQLIDIVDPSILFKDYVYVSGTSPVFVNHFEKYAQEVINRFKPSKEF